MLQLTAPNLTPTTIALLNRLQQKVDGEPDYEAQVAQAKKEWKNKGSSNPKKAAMLEIRQALGSMSFGRRCHYCEDSCNDEIEHFRPKDLFPGVTFDWDNCVYACGPCNGPKGNKWGVIDATGALIKINRHHTEPKVPPPPGTGALINPRIEDPLDFLFLDIANGTFHFTPKAGLNSTDIHRAKYTIEVLNLNARPHLISMRRNAYNAYTNALTQYCIARLSGYDPTVHVQEVLRDGPHRSVWAEIKRQRQTLKPSASTPVFEQYFSLCPELLNW